MKGIVAMMPAVALLASCADQPMDPAGLAPAFSATASTTNIVVPFDETTFNPCALDGVGEDVALSGALHILMHLTADAKGGIHLMSIYQPQRVSGVGATTGATYTAVGGTSDHQKFGRLPATFTYSNNFRLIGRGAASSLHIHENVHVVINGNGDIQTEVDHFSVSCR